MVQLRSHKPVSWAAVLLLCTATVAAVAAGPAAVPAAADDFGSQIVQEAVDLNAAHSEDQEMDAKEMESLLHWAIGIDPGLQLLQPPQQLQQHYSMMLTPGHRVNSRMPGST
jgi:hypothetical protein